MSNNFSIQGVHCSITLHFKCCSSYPDKPPSIAIHKIHGLSTDNANHLLKDLEALAAERCGEVMIFELAQHAQQFLHDHNKPVLSCYEEMLKQKEEMETMKLQDLEIKENEERQKIKSEIQKRQEMLRGAPRRVHRSSTSLDNSTDGQGDAPELVYYADNKMSPVRQVKTRTAAVCTCNKGAQVLRIMQRNNKKVYIGNCLGHSSNGSTTYLAIDDESGERLITKKWSIPPTSDFQTRNRQLTSLQQDLKVLCRLKHPSLVPYVAMETVKEAKRTAKQSYFIFRDYVLGCSLKFLLNKCKISDRYEGLKLVRTVGVGLFGALKELHSVSVVHRDLRCENVFVDEFGAVKLVGASLDARLAEMHEGDIYCDRQSQSQDIFAAAHLLLSIICQEENAFEVPPDLPSSAKDFFSRCFTEDEHTQWSAEQMLNHCFLVDAPAKQIVSHKKDENGSGSEDDEAVKKIHNVSPAMNGHSRLTAEFEVLTWLGKGAFGDVLKVKNKLDGGFYAIKRVKLNPESVQLNRKITREVKLLSRLNHENVVRYYNAWIETTTETIDTEDASVKSPEVRKKPGDSLQDVVAKLGQEIKVEWTMSEKANQKRHTSDSEDSDDDDEPDPWYNIIDPENESSSGIEFETDSQNQSITVPSENVPETPRPQSVRLHQVLYIQMEFCEKHTLRQAIDNGLSQEHFRAWRLFREIVEGLAHVHQRGMIHRDLKPVNIFLDSNDHVKIGDFGLATKAFTAIPVDEKAKQEEIGGSLTGQIGTALYVAPELLQGSGKVIYNQKVDIYSLGIILFEMFHPLTTGMERMMVLTEVRTRDIRLPESFLRRENAKQIHVIRWLLDHDASLRPTCAELLASEHVPRPVPEGALSGLLSHTLQDRGSRGYQRLIGACLEQRLSAAEDITYHGDTKTKPSEVLAALKDTVIKVFRTHGATEFSPPLLMPRAKGWDQYPNAVKVMTASGSVCHLPHDLRLPFARHVAYTGTKYMRRYVVDRVYREKHVMGFHPREIVECAFDIVTPRCDSLWSDAELLVVASRAATDSGLKVAIQLNHTEILRTLLMSCGVPADKHNDMYPVLVDVSFGRITSLQLQTHLTSLCVSNRDMSTLVRLMEAEVGVHEAKELVTPLVKQAKWAKLVSNAVRDLEAVSRDARALGCEQAKWAKLVSNAVRDLEAVSRDARAVGCECPMTVAPFLAYNATQHSGIFWQMSVLRDNDHKPVAKHRSGDIIAAGGRYDALVEDFWKVSGTHKDHETAQLSCTSVGFSMSLERMAAILKKIGPEEPLVVKNSESTLICVCMWGTAGSGRDGIAAAKRAQLARDLWAAGYNCCSWPLSSSEAHELSRSGIVLLQDDAFVRIGCWGSDSSEAHELSRSGIVLLQDDAFVRIGCWGSDSHRMSIAEHRPPPGIRKDLWAAGYNCCSWPLSSSEAHELSRSGIVLLQDDAFVRIGCWGSDSSEAHELSRSGIVLLQDNAFVRIGCWGSDRLVKNVITAADLWAAGYNCCSWPLSSSEAHKLSRSGIVLLQDDAFVRIGCWGSDRVREHKLPYIDVIDFIKQKLNPDIARTPEGNNRTISWSESEKTNTPNTSVTFITASERMTKNSKRHCENQISTQITSILVTLGLQPLLSRVRVSVLALACEAACVRMLAAHLTAPLDAGDLPDAFKPVFSSFSKRQNILEEALKELATLAKQNNQNRSPDETHLYALYSIPDSLCRLIY
ncbi:eIF-2-alpha kinase GCN2 [Ostrinia nubilalis]|uniref:eIF-2-alpha kinase GCN2 n=1 Tax=Ostrinia nubilalis TaxID=29057 RepID=UPI003082400B